MRGGDERRGEGGSTREGEEVMGGKEYESGDEERGGREYEGRGGGDGVSPLLILKRCMQYQ